MRPSWAPPPSLEFGPLDTPERRPLAVDVLNGAIRKIEEHGWSPPLPFWVAFRNRCHGISPSSRVSLVQATIGPWCMLDRCLARDVICELVGMFDHKWEALPLVRQEDVLAMLERAITALGGIPRRTKRRGGWHVTHGVSRAV